MYLVFIEHIEGPVPLGTNNIVVNKIGSVTARISPIYRDAKGVGSYPIIFEQLNRLDYFG